MERQFPKNVRQIGNVSDEPKIYVEDYVDIYLTQLQQQASEEPIGVMLIGEILNQEGQDVVYISGAMQMKEIEVTSTEIVIKEETLEEMEGERKKFFAFSQIVGWGLIESGHPMGQIREISKIHAKTFSGENTIFIWKDARDNEELYYAHKYGELMQMGGHYIYYEKNPSFFNPFLVCSIFSFSFLSMFSFLILFSSKLFIYSFMLSALIGLYTISNPNSRAFTINKLSLSAVTSIN